MSETQAFGKGTTTVVLGAILVIAAVLRISAAAGELWVDEVWSLTNIDLARADPSPGHWVSLFFHTNTHPLTTLSMIVLGPESSAFAYRTLSVASGIATVAVAAAIGGRRGPTEGLIAAALIAVSYPMVHYAGEARGYAPMLLAAVSAFWVLERHLDAPSPGKAVAFIVLSMLGLAAHLTFIAVLGGLGVWAAAVLFRRHQPIARTLVHTLARLSILFGIQAIALTAYAAIAVNNMGGVIEPLQPVAASVHAMMALTFGANPASAAELIPGLVLAMILTVWWIYRQADMSWIFLAILGIAYPLGFALADPALDTAPRYFIASGLFALMIAARGLTVLLAANRWTRATAWVLMAIFVIGNGLMLEKFFNGGRGNYTGVLRTIAGAADQQPARVSGYRQLRVGQVLRYYAGKQGLSDAMAFVSIAEDEHDPAPWFIDGGFSDGFTLRQPKPVISRPVKNGGTATYKLLASFPHWGLSGDSLAVYRRDR